MYNKSGNNNTCATPKKLLTGEDIASEPCTDRGSRAPTGFEEPASMMLLMCCDLAKHNTKHNTTETQTNKTTTNKTTNHNKNNKTNNNQKQAEGREERSPGNGWR